MATVYYLAMMIMTAWLAHASSTTRSDDNLLSSTDDSPEPCFCKCGQDVVEIPSPYELPPSRRLDAALDFFMAYIDDRAGGIESMLEDGMKDIGKQMNAIQQTIDVKITSAAASIENTISMVDATMDAAKLGLIVASATFCGLLLLCSIGFYVYQRKLPPREAVQDMDNKMIVSIRDGAQYLDHIS